MPKKIIKKKVKVEKTNDDGVKELVAKKLEEQRLEFQETLSNMKESLKDAVEMIRNDIASDVAEQISKIKVPAPATENKPADLAALKDVLKDGNLDLSKIGSLMGSLPNQTSMKLPDIGKMNPAQMEFMKHQQTMELIGKIAPAVIAGQSQQGSPMMMELMNRIFLEKIGSSMYMDKVMISAMAKNFGVMPPAGPATAVLPAGQSIVATPNPNPNPIGV